MKKKTFHFLTRVLIDSDGHDFQYSLRLGPRQLVLPVYRYVTV